MAYIYAADFYCDDCGKAIREKIDEVGESPRSPHDESSYDSDDYPKGPYPDGGGEADYPQHCGAMDDCINAIDMGDGWQVGEWLENELTAEGVEYVKESIAAGGQVAELWAEWYADCL